MTNAIVCSVDELFDQKKNALNFAKLFQKKFDAVIEPALLPVQRALAAVMAPPPMLRSISAPRVDFRSQRRRAKNLPVAKASFPKRNSFQAEAVSGTLTGSGTVPRFESAGQLKITLPVGVNVVNVATFKAMLGRPNSDTVLKRIGARWTLLDDDALIDLMDDKQSFKVGSVQVYS